MYPTSSIGPLYMKSPTTISQAHWCSFLNRIIFKRNYLQRISSFDCHLIFSFLNLPTKISPKKVHAISTVPPTSPSRDTSPGDTSAQLLVTNFLIFNPPQYKSNHHKQDLLITTSKIFRHLHQLQIAKS